MEIRAAKEFQEIRINIMNVRPAGLIDKLICHFSFYEHKKMINKNRSYRAVFSCFLQERRSGHNYYPPFKGCC